jgi:ATP:ADP antiporter, AAA family
MINPIRPFLEIRKEELPQSVLMFGYLFLVITSFWILKPIKKSLFIGYYDQTGFRWLSWQMNAAQAELLAKVLNALVALLATLAFTAATNWFRREKLTALFGIFFIASYAWFAVTITQPTASTVWAFYLFGDLFSTLMVATFFAFLNDIATPEIAKRTYGFVGLGGVLGGVFGSAVAWRWIGTFSFATWSWSCLVLSIGIIALGTAAGKMTRVTVTARRGSPQAAAADPPVDYDILAGARLVFRSRYLLSIVGIISLYEFASTLMDFQSTATIAYYLNGNALKQQFANIGAITNICSMLVQLFMTGFILKHYGVKVALTVLPLVALCGSLAFLAFPLLWPGSLLSTADNAFNYSINQSAKEALYVPTSEDEKYKAKAFIDMFVQRLAKTLSVVLSLGLTAFAVNFSSVRWLSLITVVLVAAWLPIARYAGGEFERRANLFSRG